jgi:hypothetical protein
MPEAPKFWHCFTQHFDLTDADSRRWWEALCHAEAPLRWFVAPPAGRIEGPFEEPEP